MNRMRILSYILQTTLFIMIWGCAFPISQEIRAQARQDLTFPVVARDPLAYKGATVIWGGIVIKVWNEPRQTILTILDTPLNYWEVPEDEVYGRGRFIARVAEYLDPERYDGKKKVVLAGDIVGAETKPLGETQYRYPVVEVKELHLFHESDYSRAYRPYYDQDGYGSPENNPFKGIH